MAIKISQLPAATIPTGAETIPLVQGGITSRTLLSTILSWAGASALIGFIQAGVGAIWQTVQLKLRQSVSITDFYANGVSGAMVDPTGTTDSFLGIQAALNASKCVYIPPGIYKCSGTLVTQVDANIFGAGQICSQINYTGTGALFDFAGGGFVVLKDFYATCAVVAPLMFTASTTCLTTSFSAVQIKAYSIRIEGFGTACTCISSYSRYFDCTFESLQYAFLGILTTNIAFFGCSFVYAKSFISTAGGSGALTLSGCSFEGWSDYIITASSGAISCVMLGCYVENLPAFVVTGTGYTPFTAASVVSGSITFLEMRGNSVQCSGVRYVVYSAGTGSINCSGNVYYYKAGAASSTQYIYYIPAATSFSSKDTAITYADTFVGAYTTAGASIDLAVLIQDGYDPITLAPLSTGWILPTSLGTSWSNTGTAGFPNLQCKIQGDQLVIVGRVTGTASTSTTIATLPAAVMAKLSPATRNGGATIRAGLLMTTGYLPVTYYLSAAGVIAVNSGAGSAVYDFISSNFPSNG